MRSRSLPIPHGADGPVPAVESWLRAHAVVVATALGAANLLLKIPLVGAQGLWFDEAISLSHVQGAFDLSQALATDASAPLYGIVLYGWSRLFGPSLEAARALSVLFGSATATLLFLFGRRFLDARTGLFAALLFTVSRTQTYFGHEARAYALVGLLCVASFWTFLALLEEPSRRRVLLAGVTAAALVYAHYVAVFAVVAQLLAATLLTHSRSRAWWAVLAADVVAALLFAPCLAYLLLAADPLPMAGWIAPPVPGDVLYVLQAFVGGPLLVGLYAAILGATFTAARRGFVRLDRDRVLVLGMWILAPLALDYAVSLVVPSFLYRYLLYASLGLFLLTAHALARLPVPEIARGLLVAVLVVPSAWGTFTDPILRPDWRGAAKLAERERSDGTVTIVTPAYQLLPFAYHYARDAFAAPGDLVARLQPLGVHALPTLDGLAEAVAGTPRVVLVSADDPTATPELEPPLAGAHWEQVRGANLVGVRVRVFESRP